MTVQLIKDGQNEQTFIFIGQSDDRTAIGNGLPGKSHTLKKPHSHPQDSSQMGGGILICRYQT